MKICYLILAHDNPGHCSRLIDALSAENNRIFVHIDLKSDISRFQVKNQGCHIQFIKRRIPVGWGGFSAIQATLNLMVEALESKDYCDYYVLLSGGDYPVRSQTYIRHFFRDWYGWEFMSIRSVPPWPFGKHMQRISHYHMDYALYSFPMVPWFIPQTLSRIIRRLNIPRDYSSFLSNRQLYGGSQWWALTLPAIRYILEFVRANPEFVSFYRHAYVPDECFFQTILGNSGFKKTMRRNLTYTDWSVTGKHRPAMIDSNHIEGMKSPGGLVADDSYGEEELLFARKFSDASDYLVKRIQEEVW